MGNVPISCCRSKSPRPDSDLRTGGDGHAQYSNHNKLSCDPPSLRQSTQNILQHISEREPDDSDTDPSSNPLNKPMFTGDSRYLQSSTSCDSETNPCYSRRFYLSINNSSISEDGGTVADRKSPVPGEGRYKASSCSTIFIDNSTISQPDIDQTIKCVSLAIYYHIKNRSSDEVSEIFDEEIHPLRMPDNPVGLTMSNQSSQAIQPENRTEELIILDNDNQTNQNTRDDDPGGEPDQEHIYNFVRTLFKAAQLTSEYAITTLVYLERLMTYAEMDLAPKSWRRIFLGAILLSSKVWEDQAIWNVDYAQILEGISVDDINELERHFLELIQFNMNVPSSVYAKYYFHLRTLALQNGLTEEHTLMTTGKAKELEAMSKVHLTDDWFSSPIHKKSLGPIKKHSSLEKLRSSGHARAVLM